MADDAKLRELLGSTRNGVLVTLKRDGRPQLSNVTHAFDGDVARISVTDDRAKARNMRRDPRVSLYVTAADFWSYVVAEGTADLSPVAMSPDDDTVEALVAHYRAVRGEHPDWDEFRATMVRDRRLLCRVHVERVYGMA